MSSGYVAHEIQLNQDINTLTLHTTAKGLLGLHW